MKTKLLAMMLLAGGSMFAQTGFSIGVGIGGYGGGFNQPPPSYASAIPPCPGPDYAWVDGYWSVDHERNIWVPGYWNRRPFLSGYTAAPRFDDHFNAGDHRKDFDRGSEHDRNRGFDQDRNSSAHRSENQNSGNRNDNRGGGRPGNGFANGFKGR